MSRRPRIPPHRRAVPKALWPAADLFEELRDLKPGESREITEGELADIASLELPRFARPPIAADIEATITKLRGIHQLNVELRELGASVTVTVSRGSVT